MEGRRGVGGGEEMGVERRGWAVEGMKGREGGGDGVDGVGGRGVEDGRRGGWRGGGVRGGMAVGGRGVCRIRG